MDEGTIAYWSFPGICAGDIPDHWPTWFWSYQLLAECGPRPGADRRVTVRFFADQRLQHSPKMRNESPSINPAQHQITTLVARRGRFQYSFEPILGPNKGLNHPVHPASASIPTIESPTRATPATQGMDRA
jgi:hypothetical protein